jgi:hypothetical protein
MLYRSKEKKMADEETKQWASIKVEERGLCLCDGCLFMACLLFFFFFKLDGSLERIRNTHKKKGQGDRPPDDRKCRLIYWTSNSWRLWWLYAESLEKKKKKTICIRSEREWLCFEVYNICLCQGEGGRTLHIFLPFFSTLILSSVKTGRVLTETETCITEWKEVLLLLAVAIFGPCSSSCVALL